MKQTTLLTALAIVVSGGMAFAQTSSTTTTTTNPVTGTTTERTTTTSGSGMVSAYSPGSDYITFRSETSAEPVKYYYTKQTTLVDPDGRAVEWSALRPDMPVTYTYVKEGDRMVVTKVTLNKPVMVEKETTTTSTTTTKP